MPPTCSYKKDSVPIMEKWFHQYQLPLQKCGHFSPIPLKAGLQKLRKDPTEQNPYLSIAPHSPSSSLSFSGIFNGTTLAPWKINHSWKSLLTSFSLLWFQSVFLAWILLFHSHSLLCPFLMSIQQKLPPRSLSPLLCVHYSCSILLLALCSFISTSGPHFLRSIEWQFVSHIFNCLLFSVILNWNDSEQAKLEFILKKLISICSRPELTNSVTALKVRK